MSYLEIITEGVYDYVNKCLWKLYYEVDYQ